ncbi:tetratricopeptide repeat-containing sensor histidine kinase [Mucilaginibacter flavidus]|uniref:tetratricopeptide repeat-containing sensor histidine kinase n=1 Tax=Mucilaginibacter flavidus TaxID=2949309 RepID=UPI0020939AF4|nr:tetratricopeptide repeat protein [Mucilaginibacter flavidus]MCO5945992.1 tetratricopeptide repeat protein [Mucilaginibacter flavidus]
MMLLKKGILLLCGMFTLLNGNFSLFDQNNQTADSLLKKATLSKDPIIGLSLSKQALFKAESTGNQVAAVKSLNFIAKYYAILRTNDSSRFYAKRALSNAEKNNIDSLKGDAWIYLGNADYNDGAFRKAIDRYQNAIVAYKKINKLSDVATSYLNIGNCESKLSLYSDAISNFIKASTIFENLSDNDYLSAALNSIALCYVEQKNFSKAIEYSRKSLSLRQKLNNRADIAEALNNMGFVFYRKKMPDSAIYYLNKSLSFNKTGADSSSLVLTLQNIGSSWMIKNDLPKAEKYIQRSLRIASRYEMTEDFARGNKDMAEIYLRQNKYGQALAAINITINTAKNLRLPELLMEGYGTKYRIYKLSGDYKNAVIYGDKRAQLNDSLFTISANRAITEMETKYKTAQTEKDRDAYKVQSQLQQKIVSQQTKYIVVLSIAAVLLAALFVIAYNNFRKKNKANKRIQTLMQDLHHRVKNNLQILSGLFTMQIDNLSDENTKNALRENEARLTSMNLIHNKLYLDNTTTKIEMNDYLTKLLNHIKDSFGGYKQNEINLRIEVSNIMLEADKAVAIGLIANELTTNAFKYAFNGQVHGEIHLALQLVEKSKILLTLADNGVGLKAENKDRAPSFGLKLVNLMARQLNSTLVVNNSNGVFYQMEISI